MIGCFSIFLIFSNTADAQDKKSFFFDGKVSDVISGEGIPLPVKTQVISIDEGLKNHRQLLLSEIVDTVEIVILEASLESYFPRLADIYISKNYIVISCDFQNFKKVCLFARDGSFIRIIGSKGKGPSEYVSPWYVLIDEEEKYIFITDGTTGKVLKYSLNGDFIKAIKVQNINPSNHVENIVEIDKNRIGLCMRRPSVPTSEYASILILDHDLKVTNKVLPRINDESLLSRRFVSRYCEKNDGNLFFWEAGYDTIYRLNDKFEPISKYSFDMKRNNVGRKVRNDYSRKKSDYRVIEMLRILGPYFLFYHQYKGQTQMMAYNKDTQETFSVDNSFSCDTSYLSEYHLSLTNDLFGFEPTRAFYPQNQQNAFIDVLWLEHAEYLLDLECLRETEVKWNSIRNNLADMIENYDNYEMPVILIMKLI